MDINSYENIPSYKEFAMLEDYVCFKISLKMGAFEDTLREVDGITEKYDEVYSRYKEWVDYQVKERYNKIFEQTEYK